MGSKNGARVSGRLSLLGAVANPKKNNNMGFRARWGQLDSPKTPDAARVHPQAEVFPRFSPPDCTMNL